MHHAPARKPVRMRLANPTRDPTPAIKAELVGPIETTVMHPGFPRASRPGKCMICISQIQIASRIAIAGSCTQRTQRLLPGVLRGGCLLGVGEGAHQLAARVQGQGELRVEGDVVELDFRMPCKRPELQSSMLLESSINDK